MYFVLRIEQSAQINKSTDLGLSFSFFKLKRLGCYLPLYHFVYICYITSKPKLSKSNSNFFRFLLEINKQILKSRLEISYTQMSQHLTASTANPIPRMSGIQSSQSSQSLL